MMDRVQLLLVGLPLFLFASDVIHLFSRPPPPPRHHHQPPLKRHVPPPPVIDAPLEFPTSPESQYAGLGLGVGSSVHIDFCASCSYRGTAVTMKKMLETSFPGLNIVLSNHPPTLPKRLLSKVVPAMQMGVIAVIVAGEQIFPRLGYMVPPPWFYSLRANKFGSIASTWLLGNMVQSFLQSSGAFEVYCNGELVFSKLTSQRFPGEIELRDLISKKLTASNGGGAGAM
ncbi:selT-like protein isoform X3 [Nymphaea colorata]|uniref:selT-like protein isoform X3 n=1 Tax=Nymphaea colorata TaxID=210225 RepID=UPI00129EED70|nr:selT-like protein isoform X3 [Nymphaea colorata]